MAPVQLFAPSDCEIVGLVASDNTLRSFSYSYDRDTKARLYVLEDGSPLAEGPAVLVDSLGVRWNATEVEWYTLFQRRS